MRDHRSEGGGNRSRRNSHEEGGGGVVGSELHGATLKLLLPSPISPRPGDRAPSPQMRSEITDKRRKMCSKDVINKKIL